MLIKEKFLQLKIMSKYNLCIDKMIGGEKMEESNLKYEEPSLEKGLIVYDNIIKFGASYVYD